MNTLKVKSELAELEKIRSFLKRNLEDLHLTEKDYFIIELSLIEICTNIIRYAYTPGEGDIFLKTWQQEEKVFFEIRDSGIPFDPKKVKLPDIQESIRDEKKVSLGIFLSRKLMDGFYYKRENNQNVLTMYKKIKETKNSESV